MLISKGNSDAFKEVLDVLQRRMQPVDLKRLLQLENASKDEGCAVVDCGTRSMIFTGVNIVRKFGGYAITWPPKWRK